MNWKKLLNNNRLRQSSGRTPEDARNDFESDFGRIIFSPALRRMHDKTQVFPLTTDDNIHSRLTHSMEVMSVGYSLGVKVCESETLKQRIIKNKHRNTIDLFREIPVILKNLCLIHDIGNPPFGHFGETIIKNFFRDFFEEDGKKLNLTEPQKNDFLNFDGNAQGLRVLTKLQILDDAFGLNLTFATLGAFIKYPNFEKIDKHILEKKKVGVFTSEREYFEKIVEECGLKNVERVIRHPLCYLMEAADSICYLVMDIEDGYNTNLISLEYLYDQLKDIPSIKNKITKIIENKNGHYRNDITKIVGLRIHLIETLVNLAFNNFEKNIDKIEVGNYNKELIEDDENGLKEKLNKICSDKVFKSRGVTSLEITGHSVMSGLLKYYIEFLFHKEKDYKNRAETLISDSIKRIAFIENKLDDKKAEIDDLNNYYKLRIIVDFISGMTDQHALNHYQKISGQKII